MTARVSFVERARRTVLALGWVALYAAVGFGVWFLLSRINPVSPASPWRATSIWLSGCAAFGFATWLVGVRLGKQSWDHWGWHLPHPGIATDLQAPFAVLATQVKGSSLIHDPLYEGRFTLDDPVARFIPEFKNVVVAGEHLWSIAAGALAAAAANSDELLAQATRLDVVESYCRLALDLLHRAIQLGFKDIEHLKNDPDLAVLRSRPEFVELFQ